MSSPPPTPLNVAQCTDLITDELYKTGRMFLLRRHLGNRLMSTGWSSNLRWQIINYIKEHGQDSVNISHMWSDLAKLSLETTPDLVKLELREFLSKFGQEFIEIDDTVEPPPEVEEPELKYEFQDRDAVPELPTTDVPSPVPTNLVMKPPWLFIYDGNRSPTNSVYNGSEADSDITNNENHYSESSHDSSVQTTPEHGGGTHEDRYLKQEPEDYQETTSPPNQQQQQPTSKKKLSKSKEYQARLEKERDRKRRLAEKAKLKQQADQAERNLTTSPGVRVPTTANAPPASGNRVVKKSEYESAAANNESNATTNKKSSKSSRLNQPVPSPQLSAPLRQLKIDKKSLDSPGGMNSSKLSPSSVASGGGAGGNASSATATNVKSSTDKKQPTIKTEVIEEEEEEELMDV